MQQKLYFENSRGDKLSGILSGDFISAIILCHGSASSKESSTYVRLENELNKHDVATFRFDFYGHGESEGKYEDITVSEMVDDILHARALLEKKGYSSIGLFGSSMAGQACEIAATSGKFYALVIRSGVSDYLNLIKSRISVSEWRAKGYASLGRGSPRLKYAFFEDLKQYSPDQIGAAISVPTLFVHGDADLEVPVGQSIRMTTLVPNSTLKIIKGADHRQTNHFDIMIDSVVRFILKNSERV